MQDARAILSVGHASLGDDMFNNVGGAFFQALGNAGQIGSGDGSGQGAFGRSATGSEGAGKFGADAVVDLTPQKLKMKPFDADIERARLEEKATEFVNNIGASIKDSRVRAKAAKQAALAS